MLSPQQTGARGAAVVVAEGRGWRSETVEGLRCHWTGDPEAMRPMLRRIAQHGLADGAQVDAALRALDGFGAAMVEGPDGSVVAFVDHCRSTPVFFRTDRAAVGNDARALAGGDPAGALDELGLLEFVMAGYCTGDRTVDHRVRQLRAGERALWRPGTAAPERSRWFAYLPEPEPGEEAALAEELHAVLDRCIGRVVERAAGRPIWVPLSGGLDSRLILCKLHERGYPALRAFSYGPPGNHEARVARQVAERLGADWRFVPSTRAAARSYFASETRRRYWDFADGLAALPNPQDIEPLLALRARGELPDDAVIVNGQSGDFITGGHVPQRLLDRPELRGEAAVEVMLDWIVDKHFGLWKPLVTPDNAARIKDTVRREAGLDDAAGLSRDEVAAHYERWEHDERQVKFVIHGQRIYDFLGLAWQLPLWDIELVRFFRRVPLELKAGQRLYRRVLEDWDYEGLFRGFDPTVWRWPGATIAVVPAARAAGLLFGRRAKKRVYAAAAYWGHTRNLYAPYAYTDFLRSSAAIRNSLALDARTWLGENGVGREAVDVGQRDAG